MTISIWVRLGALPAACLASGAALAQPTGQVGLYSDVTITGSVLEPSPIDIAHDAELTGMLTAPDGVDVQVFARDLVNPRMLAVSPAGHLYATRRSVGDVVMLKDDDGDGRADEVVTVASRAGMHGIAFDGDTVFLATVNDVYTAEVAGDGTFGPLTRIINDLPDGGQHPPVPDDLAPKHAGMIALLEGAEGAEFDMLYTDMQAGAHAEAVTLFATYAAGAPEGGLKAFAMETLPTLEAHKGHIDGIIAEQ